MSTIDKISLHKINLFRELADQGSITKSALNLGFSQQRYAYEMKILSDFIGAPLFFKTQQGIRLTEEGKIFSAFSREVINLYEHMGLGVLRKTYDGLTIASTYGMCEIHITQMILKFRKIHPNLKFRILSGKEFMDFSYGDIDIVLGPKLGKRDELSQTMLSEFYYFLYGSKKYLQTHGDPKSLDELKEHRLLLYTPDQSSSLDETNIENRSIESNCYRALVKLASNEGGLVSLSPQSFREYGDMCSNLVKVSMKDPYETEKYYFMYHKHSGKIKLIEEFKDVCFDYMKNEVQND